MTTVVRGPAVLATGILALTLLATSPVSADPGDLPSKSLTTRANAALSTPAEIALMKNQAAIDQVANRIKADEKQSKASTFAGLSGVVVDAKANTLHLYWHGPLSASASREVAAARNTGMAVTIHPAPFTLSQLKAERDHIADVYMSDKALSMYGFEVVSVGPKPDGSGLEVGVSTSSSTTLGPQPLPQISSTVAVQVTRMAKPQAAWRILDTQPYWGGTYMERWSVNNGQPVAAQAACTMGFSVTAGGSRAGMLTANHCGRGSWFMVGSGTPTLR
ncbi:hypothetical protein ABNF97_01640 [Plantactinospora sp. B6F1]|uniref:hypothetical protein n=1 Tax=Plantactinospora sp. B6F1 TaxID=3158971 RepID=UPI0032D91921